MADLSTHPSREELSDYSLGQLSEEKAVAIDSHISECEPCCETIVGLSSDDTFLGLLKEAGQLPTDLTVDHNGLTAKPSASSRDIPAPLAEHPRYEIVRLIGKGGMGDVYEARHRKMERRVALKVINRELVRKPEAVNRFHREVKTAAQLSHPNVVTAYDADQAGDFHFMVMEYVDGVDLSQKIKDRGALPVDEACDYIRQAAIGLQHAHERGMVHRDIKPHNLMVTTDGTVKILDFGLASLAPVALSDAEAIEARGDLTAAGAIMGTPDFISPEQADDARQADIRSDIYSLGATLYFLLSGRPPFDDASVMQKLESHAHADAEPLESLREDIPAELAAIVARMMAKDPEERYQTPFEVAEALELAKDDHPPTDSHPPQPQVKTLQRTPRFVPITLVATLFVAAIVAAVVFYIQTDNGTVRVKVLDESLAVKVSGQTIKINDDNKEITIGAGEQKQLVVSQDGSDLELVTDKFLIRRNDKIVFEVDLVQGDLVVLKNGEHFDGRKAMPPLDSENLTKEPAQTGSNESRVARKAMAQAKQLEKNGDFVKAADAYLEALRLDPGLLAYDHFATIKKAKRTREFVEVLTVDRLKRVPFANQPAVFIVRDLLKDDATCLDGNVFLKNMWEAKPSERFFLLGNRANEIWPNVTDTTFLIRHRVMPADIPAEGAGWDRFRIDIINARGGTGSGVPQNLRPLLKNTPQQKASLGKLAREVEAKTRQFSDWKAGVAVLGFLEAELGNEKRAIELFEKVLTDSAEPIPPRSAWVFGLALEGKSVALDQIVIRLYKRNLTKRYSPSCALNVSSIGSLARLYAKYDRRDEARKLLLRLSEPEGPGTGDNDSQFVSCPYGSKLFRQTEVGRIPLPEDQVPQSNCTECHRKERNLENYILMANCLTDIGYPVEARLALGRIGSSFYNALGSDRDWAKANTSLGGNWEYQGEEAFQPARAKAEKAITPKAVLKAFESGVTIHSDMEKSVIAKSASRIELMLDVRGENGKSTLFSPVIDMLEIAANVKGDEAAVANVQIDQLLSAAFDKNPDNIEAGIAATVFAFLRDDIDTAAGRLKKLRAARKAVAMKPKPSDVALWLVARQAVMNERTKTIGKELAEQALKGAAKQSDPLWKDAILREREEGKLGASTQIRSNDG